MPVSNASCNGSPKHDFLSCMFFQKTAALDGVAHTQSAAHTLGQ